MRTLLLLAFCLSACDGMPNALTPPPQDIVGPFSGSTQRFAVDRITLPMMRSDFSDDLNGDGKVDNQLGSLCSAALASQLQNPTVEALFASGVLAPTVEITSDDPALENDPTVGVRFVGAPGAPADTMGAVLEQGTLLSTRIVNTRAPAGGELHLPIFGDADPTVFPVRATEIDLDSDGDGGFSGTLRGAFPGDAVAAAVYPGFTQRTLADPTTVENNVLLVLDANNDGRIDFDEFATNQVVANILDPDVQLTIGGAWQPSKANGAKDSFSFAFQFHLTPCPTGNCVLKPPITHCGDRLLDGDETEIDCGGSCLACPAGASCKVDGDCQTRACDGGACRAPTCTDGIHDGFETTTDCGSVCGGCIGDFCGGPFFCKVGTCVMNFCS